MKNLDSGFLRARVAWTIPRSRRIMLAGLWIVVLASVAEAQVGKRTKLQGQKATVERVNLPDPSSVTSGTPSTFGSLKFTTSGIKAWKTSSVEALESQLPEGNSLYVIGNPTRSREKLKEELGKIGPDVQIIDESHQSVVVQASQAATARLIALKDQPWLEIVAPLTPDLKLTPELKSFLSKVRSQGSTRPATDPLPRPRSNNAVQPMLMVPEGQVPDSPQAVDAPNPRLADPPVNVTFYLFKDQSGSDVDKKLQTVGGKDISKGRNGSIIAVRATVPASAVVSVAASNEIREVTLAPKFIKHNDVAGKVMSRVLPAPPGVPYVSPIKGTGQVVGHSDSGLDLGRDDGSLHPAFRGRLKRVFALGRPAPVNDWSDRGGHGSHTAGSILGSGLFPGIAPDAMLVHQSLDDDKGTLAGIPLPLGNLFDEAYGAGARVHSNSWGVSAIDPSFGNINGGVYGDGQQVDDWTWNGGKPRDMLIVYSAGNDGDFPDAGGKMTVASPGTAKNSLTVGASENYRPAGGDDGDNVADLAFFSSKGPTRDNRIKPDVVAPGTWVASVKTQGEQIFFRDGIEGGTNGWTATAGFQAVMNPPGGALSGTTTWRLSRPAGSRFQDTLTTPSISLNTGHNLNFELWVRGDMRGLDQFHVGYKTAANAAMVFPDTKLRLIPGWTILTASLPRIMNTTTVRFLLVAQETSAAGLTSPIELFIDDFKVTTFSSWGPVSRLGLTSPESADDQQYTFDGGTSMAAPLTAGVATLVRQSLTDNGTAVPSAELLKAILINSADSHRGRRPNFQSGWGLVNLRRAIEGDYQFDFETQLKNGEEMNYDIDVPAGIAQFRVTLVWADSPNPSLVNDLNLTVTSPVGVVTFAEDPDGNVPDRTNNVEGVDVPTPASGKWKVKVTAHKVSSGINLPFSIVMSQLK